MTITNTGQIEYEKGNKMEIFDCFHEDWGGNASPEQIAEDLREARTFTRNVDLEWTHNSADELPLKTKN